MSCLIITRARKGVFLLWLLLVWSEAAVAAVAGTLDFVAGDVRIRSAEGVERVARKGDLVNVGDHVITGALGNAQLRMIDKAYLAVRPESELDIKDYRYSERSDGSENALLSLVRGTMRAFTGSITSLNRERFVMATPTATIGIRGSGNVLHFSPTLGTLNHTIEGSHAVSSVNQQGQVIGTIITTPGQTVQVLQNQPPARVSTPPFLLQAATSQPRAPGQGQQGQQGGSGGSGDSGATGGTTAAAGRATAAPDAALTSAASTVSTPATTTGTTTANALPAPATTTNLSGTSGTEQVSLSTQTVTTSTGTTGTLSITGTGSVVVVGPGSTGTVIGPGSTSVVLDPSLNYGHGFLATKAAGAGFESVTSGLGINVFSSGVAGTGIAGSNYVFSGNALTDIRSADAIDAFGLTYEDTTTSFFGPGARYVKFAGGTAQDAFALANNSVVLGRWQGGTVNIYSDPGATGGTSLLESISLGSRSASWIVFQQPPANFAAPLTGTSTYSLLAATRPTDSLGNVGTLNSASLSANFSAQTVQAGLNLGIAARDLTFDAKTPVMAMQPGNAGFGSQFITCTVATCPTISALSSIGIGTLICTGTGCPSSSSPGYLGFLQGGFGGTTATGPAAGFTYSFQSFTQPTTTTAQTPFNDVIQGVALFQAGAASPAGISPTAVGSTGKFLTQAIYPVFGTSAAGFAGVDRTTTGSGSLASNAFLLDASGNLVRVTGAAWNVSDSGTSTQCLLGAPCLLSTTPTSPAPDASAIFSMGGGTVGAKGSTFNANGDFTGAAATERFFDSTTGTRFGRYAGGVVNAASLAPTSGTGSPLNVITDLGSNSVIWAVREVPASIPLTGTYHYLPQFATAPTDSLGNVGVLNSARLDVDFSRQVVDPGVRITINNQTIGASTNDVPLSSNFSFNVTTSSTENALLSPAPPNRIGTSCFGATCPQPPVGAALSTSSGGTGSGYGARFTGGLSGDGTAKGAFLAYTFNTYYDTTLIPGSGSPNSAPAGVVANNYISGYVGLGLGPQFQPPTTPGSNVIASYFYWPSNQTLLFGSNDNMQSTRFGALASGVTTDAAGNLTSVTDYDPSTTTPSSLTISGGTLPGTVTTTANGISFGRYSGQTVAQGQASTGTVLSLAGNDDFSFNGGPFGPPSANPGRNVVGSLQWIKGPELFPFFLAGTLTGTVSFSLIGNSPPTDQNGVTGTLGSASLSVNFFTQAANATLSNIVVPAANGSLQRTWNATANGMALSGDGAFSAFDSTGVNPLAHRNLNVTMTTPGTITSPQSAFGDIHGSLTGTGANGAILAYTFAANDSNNLGAHEHVNGTAAFASSFTAAQIAQNLNTNYAIRLAATGVSGGFSAANFGAPPVPAGSIDDQYLAWTFGEAVNPGRIVRNLQGQVIEYDGKVAVVGTNPGCTTSCPPHNVNEIATRVSVNPSPSDVIVPVPSPGTGTTSIPGVTGAASILDSGVDPTTGIYWGRYANGNRAIADRITGITTVITDVNGPHYIFTPSQNGPTVLPLTGSATYTLVGNTNPTDNLGHVGTLNSATLAANFTAQTVNTSVNATVAGTNIVGTGANLPIQQGFFFGADKPLSGTGALSMSCSGGSCNPAAMTGHVIGVFTGTTGQGAAMAYSLNTGAAQSPSFLPGQAISGVAAFKR